MNSLGIVQSGNSVREIKLNIESILKRIHPTSSFNELDSTFSSLGEKYNTLYALANTLKTFLESADASDETINRWKEIETFLNGITDKQSLTSMLNSLKEEIKQEVTSAYTQAIATAKSEAIQESKSYTDEKVAALTPPSPPGE